MPFGEWSAEGREDEQTLLGWYWRDTDFDGKHVEIGDCGSFIGVMENNKWDYRERCMIEEEVDHYVRFWTTGAMFGESWDVLTNRQQEDKDSWEFVGNVYKES